MGTDHIPIAIADLPPLVLSAQSSHREHLFLLEVFSFYDAISYLMPVQFLKDVIGGHCVMRNIEPLKRTHAPPSCSKPPRGPLRSARLTNGYGFPDPNVPRRRKNRRYFDRIALVVALAGAACLDAPVTPPFGSPLLVHSWTIILQSDYGKVWIAQTDTANVISASNGPDSVPARLWVTLDGPPAQQDLTLWTFIHDGQLDWHLDYHGEPIAQGKAPFYADTYQWVLRADGRASFVWGNATLQVAFNAIADMPMPTEPVVDPVAPASIAVPTGGVVSLRIDDCHAEDSASLRVLDDLKLVAEFAVPSRLVGLHGECTSGLLAAMVLPGGMIESHSRNHGAGPPDFANFYIETVGSARDLQAMGYPPHDFIQPGTWTGDFYFDSPAKLAGPAGALLRRVYVAVEAYAYTQTNIALPTQGDIGPSSLSIRGYTAQQVDQLVRQAAQNHQWIQFMWHSGDQPTADLKARLSAIAALRDSGYVKVMPFYLALHAAP